MKKIIIISIVAIIFIAGGLGGWFWWITHEEKVNYCKEMCSYDNEASAWQCCGKSDVLIKIYGDRYFPTQKQCIDYCLIRDAEYRNHPEMF